ncbi:PAS domain S-box protein [Cohnella sp. GCM10027633]|uniref:PAS domain S-box protein n=1 Tax=unclassified Cohnella TaxID=2636738 RepID=UPI00363C4723
MYPDKGINVRQQSAARVIAIIPNPLADDRNMLRVLKTFLDRTSDSVFIADRNGITLEVNRRFEELYGISRERIVGRVVPLEPEGLAAVETAFANAAGGDEVAVPGIRRFRANGEAFMVDVVVAPMRDDSGELFAFIVVESDVTGKQNVENKLRESEERYRVLVHSLPEPILVYRDFIIVFVNPAAYRLLGASAPEQLLGRHVSEFMHPDERPDYDFIMEHQPCAYADAAAKEHRSVRLDGTIVHVEVNPVPINYKGQPAVQLMFRDVTEQKLAKAKLAAKEKELSRILKLSPEPIVLHQAGIITFVNDMGIKLLRGASIDQFVGKPVVGLFCDSQHPDIVERMKRVVDSEEYMEFVELKLKPLAGEVVDVEVASICVYKYLEQPVVQIVIRDLTDRKRAEELVRRSEKLSVAGELAAGVAHEIRNPLTALRGFMQLLKAKNTDYVDIMLMEIDRISYIVNEFIGMAKPQALNFISCDLTQLIESVITFMQPQALLFSVQMELAIGSDVGSTVIECEPNQIKQVYMNVLKNAIESMPRGGSVSISIMEGADGHLLTRIVDQGVGIPEERLGKIGEPFFSLKESGTGLGLMVCNKIVEAHRGKLRISSTVGVGTTIEVSLPIRLNAALRT